MKILITGGSGFIGTNLVEYYLAQGDEVLNVDCSSPRNVAHEHVWKNVDLLDAAALKSIAHNFNPDVVIHMAARTDLDGRTLADYAANTVGVENLIAAIKDIPTLQRVIFASSRLVCRIGYSPKNDTDYCPTTIYGESKVIGEKIVQEAGNSLPCPWLIVRPTSIWGPWFDIPYKTFFLTIAKNRYVHPGRSTILKSFGFVGNSVYQLQSLINAPVDAVSGKTFYLADYPPIDVAIMANTIQHELGVKPIRTVNTGILRLAAWMGDVLKMMGMRNPPLTSFRLDNLLTPMLHDMEPLSDVVGDLQFSMEDGVGITVKWLRSHGEVS